LFIQLSLFNIANLHYAPLLRFAPGISLADSLIAYFFTNKISKLYIIVASKTCTSFTHAPSPSKTPPGFSFYRPTFEFEISKILLTCSNKSPDSDPGFWKNVLLSLFLPSPTSSISHFKSVPCRIVFSLSKHPISFHFIDKEQLSAV